VSINRPATSTEQILATASNGVSSTLASVGTESVCASDGVFGAGVFFFVILSLFVGMPCHMPKLQLRHETRSTIEASVPGDLPPEIRNPYEGPEDP
jgi:hypothetical protein